MAKLKSIIKLSTRNPITEINKAVQRALRNKKVKEQEQTVKWKDNRVIEVPDIITPQEMRDQGGLYDNQIAFDVSTNTTYTPQTRRGGGSGGSSLSIPQSTITSVRPSSSTIERVRSEVSAQRQILSQRRRRNLKQELGLFGLTVGQTALEYGISLKDLPKNIKELYKNPNLIKQLPKAVQQELIDTTQLLRSSPTEAVAKIGTDIIIFKGQAKAIKVLGNLSNKSINKLIGAKELKTGKNIKVNTPSGKVTLKVVSKIPTQSLSSQVKLSGRKVTAVSTQADKLLTLLKSNKIIRKPIPNEATFSMATKKLLSKFDKGTITKNELIKLNKLVKKQGAKGLLERSFFVDPSKRIRPSRLGIKNLKEANILDILSGNVTFKTAKPQILLFKDIKVSALPKSLKSVGRKLSRNKPLTQSEANKLLQWQLKRTGKFKPIGFISRESELTLAPNEVIKKVKTLSYVSYKGKRIPIIQAKVLKSSGKLKKLLNKKKLTQKEIKQLNKLLKKKTGFNYNLSSSKKSMGRYLPLKRYSSSALLKGLTKYKPKSKIIYKKGISKPISRTKYKPRSPSPTYPKSPIPRKPRSPSPTYPKSPKSPYPSKGISRPPIIKPRPRIKPPIITPKIINKTRFTKGKKVGYIIQEKRGKRFVRLKSPPLSYKQAKDRLAYRLDNKISRTARLLKIRTNKIGRLSKREKDYFSKFKYKFRPYKIRKGKKYRIYQKFIEKRKYIQDRTGEKAQLRLNRRFKQRPRKIRKRRNSLSSFAFR